MAEMGGWGGRQCDPNPPNVTETDNLVRGQILGPRGQVLSEARERSTVPVGMAVRPKTPTRIHRRP